MKIVASPPIGRLVDHFLVDLTGNLKIGDLESRSRSLGELSVHRVGSLYLLNKNANYDLQSYQELNLHSSLDDVATDIELRENRISIVERDEAQESQSIKDVLLLVFSAFDTIYAAIREKTNAEDWVLWANIQCQLGDFDADVEDLRRLTDESLITNTDGWWYLADISFAKNRQGAASLLKQRVAHDWGTSLSPLQTLFVPSSFQ